MDACNLQTPGRNLRLGLGLVLLMLTLGAGVWMISGGWSAPARLVLFPAFWAAALALLQAREKV